MIVQGIAAKRIILEDQSTKTIENALFSVDKLIDYKAKTITLITSFNHMWRSYFLFEQTYKLKQTTIKINQVVTSEKPQDLALFKQAELRAMMDDGLRLYVFWQGPGIKRQLCKRYFMT